MREFYRAEHGRRRLTRAEKTEKKREAISRKSKQRLKTGI
jgi:hypothetical protein